MFTKFNIKRPEFRLPKNSDILALIVVAYVLFIITLYFNVRTNSFQHFTVQAESFLHGQVDLIRLDQKGFDLDTVQIGDKYYWPLGVFPSFVLIPFVLLFNVFGLTFLQGFLNIFLTIAIAFLAYKIARHYKFNKKDSAYLGFGFIFSSIYVGIAIASFSWYFSQAIVVFLMMLALYEYICGQKRFWVIGLLFAGIVATRNTAGLSILFFILHMLMTEKNNNKFIKNMFFLLLPFSLGILIIFINNYLKFGSIFESGYLMALIQPKFQEVLREKYGLFDLRNIVTNIYWYFFSTPIAQTQGESYHLVFPFIKADPKGLSFFLVSPIYFMLFKIRKLNKEMISSIITCSLVLLALLTYYASGYSQYGPRYMLDFFPILYLLLLNSFKKNHLSRFWKTVILISSILNLLLAGEIFAPFMRI